MGKADGAAGDDSIVIICMHRVEIDDAKRLARKKSQVKSCKFFKTWWASRESNTAPTDYESAALTKHELEARKSVLGQALTRHPF